AVERAAAADHGADDGPAAARARLARAVVRVELPLHPSGVPARVTVVAARRPAEADPLAQHPADGLVQPRRLRGPQRARRTRWVDARAPEGLDRVDVPDARDGALIEQQRLDRGARPVAEQLREPGRG